MAEQNCAHLGCDCKIQDGKGVSRVRKSTAAIIVLTRRCRGLEETAVAVIRIANNEGNTDSTSSMSMTCLADEYRRAQDLWLLWIDPPYRTDSASMSIRGFFS